jgi:hypothetical protein
LQTRLNLTSVQDVPLTAVTTIYCCGQQVLSLDEALPLPSRVSASRPGRRPVTSATSSPASPDSPATPESDTFGGPKHKHCYSAPFAKDFWEPFLAGSTSSAGASFSKTQAEREDLASAISGMVVYQEFVFQSDDCGFDIPTNAAISPGSAKGDVILVVVYDFQVQEQPAAEISFLSLRKPAAPVTAPSMFRRGSLPNVPRRPSMLSQEAIMEFKLEDSPPPSPVPEIQLATASPRMPPPQAKSERKGLNKPNLVLSIPAPGMLSVGETPPITRKSLLRKGQGYSKPFE